MSTNDPLARAIKAAGSQAALASAIGVSQQAISFWVKRGMAPAEKVVAIEKATGVTRQELRPDIFGAPVPTGVPA